MKTKTEVLNEISKKYFNGLKCPECNDRVNILDIDMQKPHSFVCMKDNISQCDCSKDFNQICNDLSYHEGLPPSIASRLAKYQSE
jgi:hypothetical protein